MARKRVAVPLALQSWAEVDTALRDILYCNGCIGETEIMLNREIAEARERADVRTRPIRERIRKLEVQIREYVDQHRDKLTGKSRQLNFGRVGYRLSTRLVVPRQADVLARLHQYGMDDCITVRESVNKEALRRRDNEDILRTGAYLRTNDEYWYEVSADKVEPAE